MCGFKKNSRGKHLETCMITMEDVCILLLTDMIYIYPPLPIARLRNQDFLLKLYKTNPNDFRAPIDIQNIKKNIYICVQ
jgi:hypothetical protein